MEITLLLHYVSLAITPIVYFSLFVVLAHYTIAAVKNGKPKQPWEWLVMGIVISMALKVPDNGFWNTSWSAYLFGDPEPWFAKGPGVNILCRQLPIILACFCHWMAEYKSSNKINWKIIICCLICAFILFGSLTFIGANFNPPM